jgi:hypothetical protein
LLFYSKLNLSVKGVAGDGNDLFLSHTKLLEIVSHHFVLRYLIADAETVSCCAEFYPRRYSSDEPWPAEQPPLACCAEYSL